MSRELENAGSRGQRRTIPLWLLLSEPAKVLGQSGLLGELRGQLSASSLSEKERIRKPSAERVFGRDVPRLRIQASFRKTGLSAMVSGRGPDFHPGPQGWQNT